MSAVLVTGATGFVAGYLIPALAQTGHQVYALGYDAARLERFSAHPGIQPVVADLRNRDLAGALPARLDAIVHLAQANTRLPAGAADLFEVNTASTQRLLDYARGARISRFLLASTGSVYGGGDRPWREDDPAEADDYYAATKMAAERLVRAYGGDVPYTIFRLFAPYGPRQMAAHRRVPGLIERVRAGQPVTLREAGRPRINPLYVAHVVDVLRQSIDTTGNQLVNLAGDEVLSVRDMAEIIGRVLGVAPVLENVPGPAGGDTVGDVTRLRQLYLLPERLTSFEEGVRAMVAAG